MRPPRPRLVLLAAEAEGRPPPRGKGPPRRRGRPPRLPPRPSPPCAAVARPPSPIRCSPSPRRGAWRVVGRRRRRAFPPPRRGPRPRPRPAGPYRSTSAPRAKVFTGARQTDPPPNNIFEIFASCRVNWRGKGTSPSSSFRMEAKEAAARVLQRFARRVLARTQLRDRALGLLADQLEYQDGTRTSHAPPPPPATTHTSGDARITTPIYIYRERDNIVHPIFEVKYIHVRNRMEYKASV